MCLENQSGAQPKFSKNYRFVFQSAILMNTFNSRNKLQLLFLPAAMMVVSGIFFIVLLF